MRSRKSRATRGPNTCVSEHMLRAHACPRFARSLTKRGQAYARPFSSESGKSPDSRIASSPGGFGRSRVHGAPSVERKDSAADGVVPWPIHAVDSSNRAMPCRSSSPRDARTVTSDSRRATGAPNSKRVSISSTSVFAVDVFATAFVDNHWHGGIRSRPDVAQRLSPEEIARRWLTAHPMRAWRRAHSIELDAPPSDAEIAQWLADRERDDANLRGGERGHGLASTPRDRGGMHEYTLDDARVRVCDPSWFMRLINEPTARELNRRDNRTGPCFGRFHSSEIGDSGGELSAAIYIDLNEWRAGMVPLPEDTTRGSLRKRIAAVRAGVDSGLPMIAGYTDAQYLALLDAVARFERFGRVPGSNRVNRKPPKALRTLPADTPGIFERLGLHDVGRRRRALPGSGDADHARRGRRSRCARATGDGAGRGQRAGAPRGLAKIRIQTSTTTRSTGTVPTMCCRRPLRAAPRSAVPSIKPSLLSAAPGAPPHIGIVVKTCAVTSAASSTCAPTSSPR